MTPKGTALIPLLLTLACGSAPQKAPEAPKTVQKAKVEKKTEPTEVVTPERAIDPRKLGDFFVYRYSGSFSEESVTLIEQVVAEEFGLLVVDFVLEQGDDMEALRVRMKPGGQPVSAAVLGPDGETPAELSAYEKMMARTQFQIASNDGTLGADDSTCLIGTDEVDCSTTTYAVKVGATDAVLSVTKSEAVPGRDLGGEILGSDGAVLYRAELVERGNETPGANAVAWGGRSLRFTPPTP
jgi:hypothetical protein